MLLLAYDTETGGLKAKTASLLTGYFAVVDEKFNFVAELDLKIRPASEDEPYMASFGALKTNKINLVEHYRNAVPLSVAKELLRNFVEKYKPSGYDRLVPLGHNLRFDDNFVYEHLMPEDDWSGYVSCFKLDTQNIAYFVYKVLNRPNPPKNFQLGTLGDHFGIPKGTLHTARGDAILSVLVFQELVKLLKG